MAETSMVEKVARAIWRAREKQFPERVRRPKPDTFDNASGAWDMVLEQARAAIEAMREPTEEMIEANWSSIQSVDQELRMRVSLMSSKDAHQIKAKCRWRAMIDAALNGKEG